MLTHGIAHTEWKVCLSRGCGAVRGPGLLVAVTPGRHRGLCAPGRVGDQLCPSQPVGPLLAGPGGRPEDSSSVLGGPGAPSAPTSDRTMPVVECEDPTPGPGVTSKEGPRPWEKETPVGGGRLEAQLRADLSREDTEADKSSRRHVFTCWEGCARGRDAGQDSGQPRMSLFSAGW